MKKHFLQIVVVTGCILILFSCTKAIQVSPPVSSITTAEVFDDSTDANSAILGIYSRIATNLSGNIDFGTGALTWLCGLSADELVPFTASRGSEIYQQYTNSLSAQNGTIYYYLWESPYAIIYMANASIEGLQNSTGISLATKNQFIAEAKFLRCLCYFYLINLFGNVPYVTTSSWQNNSLAPDSTSAGIYNGIIADLKFCQTALRSDYSISGGERTRANQASATALLARVYLYTGDWADAETQATSLINNPLFALNTDPNSCFLANNQEAILQWESNPNFAPFNITLEGLFNLPYDSTSPPQNYYLSTEFLSAFDSGDLRRTEWVDSTDYNGQIYYYPNKYNLGAAQTIVPSPPPTQYYTVFRLAEQYLIRAEARAEQGEQGAAADINAVRSRANLGPTPAVTSLDLLNATAHERQIELFAEWGHRWLDLKRTSQINSVMATVTPLKSGGYAWQPYQQFYPIALSELQADPNLSQNQGY